MQETVTIVLIILTFIMQAYLFLLTENESDQKSGMRRKNEIHHQKIC